MKLQAVSGIFFKGFKDDLQRAKNILNQNTQVDSFMKSGGTIIIEKVEIKEDNSAKGKIKKVSEGVVTATAAGATGGVLAKSANDTNLLKHNEQTEDISADNIDDNNSDNEIDISEIDVDKIDDNILNDNSPATDNDDIAGDDDNNDDSDDEESIPLSIAMKTIKTLNKIISQ